MTLSSRSVVVLFVGVLVLLGCRTYGDEGYRSEAKVYEAIQKALQQMEQDLSRAQADFRRLETAAESVDTLQALAGRYRALIQTHEAALEQHRTQAKQLSSDSPYRTLHRVYGAMVTDRRLLQRQYQRATRKVWATVRDSPVPEAPFRFASTYSVTPVQYPQAERDDVSMAEALQGVEEAPEEQMEEQPSE